VTSGASATLTWSSTNATSCTATGSWTGGKGLSGTQSTGALTSLASYTLTCTGAGGTAAKTATVGVSSSSAIPTLVQHVSAASTRNQEFSPGCYAFQLAGPTTAGNALLVSYTMQKNVAATVTDDAGDTFNPVMSQFNSQQTDQAMGIAAAFNVHAGARKISVCYAVDAGFRVQPMASEFANVVGVDGSGSANGASSGTSITSGSLTPTQSNDLVYQVTMSRSQSQSGYTAGNQANVSWNLLSADLLDGWAAQYGVYGATTAFSPTMTAGKSDTWLTASVLLVAGNSGAVPPGLRIAHLLHENVPKNSPAGGSGNPFANPVVTQFPCNGNLVVAMIAGGNQPLTVTGVSDSNTNTWAQAGSTAAAGDATAMSYYAGNATCTTDLKVSTQFSSGNGDYTILFYDVVGAASTPLDKTNSGGGDYMSNGDFTMPFTLTPSASNEMVFATIAWDYNTAVGLTGAYIDTAHYTAEGLDGPSPVDENNGWGHLVSTGTTPISFTWQVFDPTQHPIRGWAAVVAAFKAAP
jgi:hypothetical protein